MKYVQRYGYMQNISCKSFPNAVVWNVWRNPVVQCIMVSILPTTYRSCSMSVLLCEFAKRTIDSRCSCVSEIRPTPTVECTSPSCLALFTVPHRLILPMVPHWLILLQNISCKSYPWSLIGSSSLHQANLSHILTSFASMVRLRCEVHSILLLHVKHLL